MGTVFWNAEGCILSDFPYNVCLSVQHILVGCTIQCDQLHLLHTICSVLGYDPDVLTGILVFLQATGISHL
jgi:hypothetical protein